MFKILVDKIVENVLKDSTIKKYTENIRWYIMREGLIATKELETIEKVALHIAQSAFDNVREMVVNEEDPRFEGLQIEEKEVIAALLVYDSQAEDLVWDDDFYFPIVNKKTSINGEDQKRAFGERIRKAVGQQAEKEIKEMKRLYSKGYKSVFIGEDQKVGRLFFDHDFTSIDDLTAFSRKNDVTPIMFR